MTSSCLLAGMCHLSPAHQIRVPLRSDCSGEALEGVNLSRSGKQGLFQMHGTRTEA